MTTMTINVGHPAYGYKSVHEDFHFKNLLENYIHNIAPQYEGEFVDENISLAKRILSGKKVNMKKVAKIACYSFVFTVAVYGLINPSICGAQELATSVDFDIKPLTIMINSLYMLMLKVAGIIATPYLAWCGYTIMLGGSSPEKRTRAKQMFFGIVGGILLLVATPYISSHLIAWAKAIFS